MALAVMVILTVWIVPQYTRFSERQKLDDAGEALEQMLVVMRSVAHDRSHLAPVVLKPYGKDVWQEGLQLLDALGNELKVYQVPEGIELSVQPEDLGRVVFVSRGKPIAGTPEVHFSVCLKGSQYPGVTFQILTTGHFYAFSKVCN